MSVSLKVALKVQLVVLVSAFMMVSTVWSVSCSSAHCAPVPCPSICKKKWGARATVPHGVSATDCGHS